MFIVPSIRYGMYIRYLAYNTQFTRLHVEYFLKFIQQFTAIYLYSICKINKTNETLALDLSYFY